MQDRMRHARGYWRKCRLRMRGEETGRQAEPPGTQRGLDSGLRSISKTQTQRHSEAGQGQRALMEAAYEKPEEGVAPVRKPCSVRAGSSPTGAPSWLPKGQKGQSANHAPCPAQPGREWAALSGTFPSFFGNQTPLQITHSTAPGQDIRSTLWRARSPVFIFRIKDFRNRKEAEFWGLTYPRSDEGFWVS